MTSCTNGPNGTRCHTCVVWDEAMHRVRMAKGELEVVKFWKCHMHDQMQSTIARETRRANVAEAKFLLLRADMRRAIDTLRNVLGRTIEMRVDPATGKPYVFMGDERREALALAGGGDEGSGAMSGPKWQADGGYTGLTEPDYLVLYAAWATIRLARAKDRDDRSAWFVTCEAVNMRHQSLGDIPMLEAKRVAVSMVRRTLRAALDDLEAVKV